MIVVVHVQLIGAFVVHVGVVDVTVGAVGAGGAALTVSGNDCVLDAPFAAAVTCSVNVPAAPGVPPVRMNALDTLS